MKDNFLISVIVPVYNIKKEYLERCIESICNQTYQNLEINLKKGKQILNGEKALNYLRYRKGYTEGELQRDEAQLQFVQNLILQKNNVENLKKIPA